jgi:endonuclease G, mitochondrial
MKTQTLLAFLSLGVIFSSCKKDKVDPVVNPVPPPVVTVADNDPLLFGNPTNAKTNATFAENYLIDQTYYKIAYSSSRAIPVWVGWHLQSEDMGSTPRQDDFRGDPKLPINWYKVETSNYSGSLFDRGHNIPSADRTSSVAANSSTFLMTNIIPQAPMLNQGPWEGLEDYLRNTLVGTTKEAYIFSGNYGTGGYNSNNILANTIDNGNITVPKQVWKVAVIMPKGNNDLSRLDTTAIVLVVDMENDNRLWTTSSSGKSAWRTRITTISNLEQSSAANGVTLDFLTGVNATVRTYLKAKRYN